MVTIKFKKEAIQPLIDAGLFDQWLANFKEQWKTEANMSGNRKDIKFFEQCTSPYDLITYGFVWDKTPENYLYWNSIHAKDLPKINKD